MKTFLRFSFLLLLPLFSVPASAQEHDGLLAAPPAAQLDVNPITIGEKPDPLDNLNIETEKPVSVEELFDRMPDAVKEEILDRSMGAQIFCQNSYMLGRFYDCECYGMTYMEKLVRQGPDEEYASPSYMQAGEIYNGCVDTAGVAGYSYDRCRTSLFSINITTDALESACECTAREMAAEYAAHPVSDASSMDGIFTTIMVKCQQNAARGLIRRENAVR